MSAISRYAGGVVPKTRYHYYAGTEALLPGYAMCFDTAAANAAATEEQSRLGNLVTKPATANLTAFAGIVAPGSGITGPGYVKLIVPERGTCVDAFVGSNTTVNATALAPTDGQWYLAAHSDATLNLNMVASAMETDATLGATPANTQVYLR